MRTRSYFLMCLVPVTYAIAQALEPSVTLRVNTQLVQVSVVVKDSHGNPVTDLKAGDFELYDGGKKQEIRVFNLEDYRPAAAGQPPAAPIAPAAPAVSALEAGMFSNRTPVEPGAPNAPTIVVIDAGNTWDPLRMTWADLVYARDELIKFLRQIHPEDRLGIYLMGSDRFWILHEYTQPCTDIVKRLAAWTPKAAPEAGSPKALDVWSDFAMRITGVDAETAKAIHRGEFNTANPMMVSALPADSSAGAPSAQGQVGTPAAGRAANLSEYNAPLAILGDVADHLAAVPGRKNVVFVSGKTFLPTQYYADLLQVLRPIIQDGVAVYTIDPGGLAPYAVDASYELSGPAKIAAMSDPRGAMKDVQLHFDQKRLLSLRLQDSLTRLAETTGGRVFFATNDISGAIRSAFDDSRVTYTLGFYPKNSSNDGSFHSIKVKVLGRDHLSLRYRDGYFEPDPPQQDPQLRQAQVLHAVFSPVDATAIELTGSVSSVAGHDFELKLKIGLASVSMSPDGGQWNGHLDVAVYGRDDAGKAYESASKTVDLKLPQDSYDKALKDGLPYDHSFRLDPKASSLRVIVRDLSSGNLGSLTMPAPAGAPLNLANANPMEKELESLGASPHAGNAAASASAPFFYDTGGASRVDLAIEIPSPVLTPTEVSGKLHAEMDVLGLAYKSEGEVAARFSETVKFDFDNRQQFDAFLSRPLRYQHQFEIAPGNYRFRLIFRTAKDRFGVVETRLAIDRFDASRLSLSSIALSRDVQPISPEAAQEETEAGRNPLIFRGNRITVSGSDLFSKTGIAEAYFEIYEPPAAGAQPVQLSMRLRLLDAQSEPKWDSGDVDLSALAKSGDRVIPVALRLPVATLAPGAYRAELTVKDSAGSQATRSVQFRAE
ncbi:MAG: VWA domain-containing protein [Bryobacteraceae bacterium]